MTPTPPPSSDVPTATPAPADWNKLPLEHLPQATFWPAGLALAVTFIFWGFVSSWVVFAVGAGLFAASFAGWIVDLRHERKHHS